MGKKETENLNSVYMEISNQLGENVAKAIYELFKGQQICFPLHFYTKEAIYMKIREEYNGSNIRHLAKKYGYSEKTVRRILKDEKVTDSHGKTED